MLFVICTVFNHYSFYFEHRSNTLLVNSSAAVRLKDLSNSGGICVISSKLNVVISSCPFLVVKRVWAKWSSAGNAKFFASMPTFFHSSWTLTAVTNYKRHDALMCSRRNLLKYNSFRVEVYKVNVKRLLSFVCCSGNLFLLYPPVTKRRWRYITDKTASALEFFCVKRISVKNSALTTWFDFFDWLSVSSYH